MRTSSGMLVLDELFFRASVRHALNAVPGLLYILYIGRATPIPCGRLAYPSVIALIYVYYSARDRTLYVRRWSRAPSLPWGGAQKVHVDNAELVVEHVFRIDCALPLWSWPKTSLARAFRVGLGSERIADRCA
jgi:hypothetical protein